jgi:GWT1
MYEFVVHAPRIDFISANKEGICTVLGYLSIYYFGVGVGKRIFCCRTRQDWRRLVLTLTISVAVLWIILTILLEGQYGIVLRNIGQDMHIS